MIFLVSILSAAGAMLCAQAQDPVAQEAERMEGVWRFDSIEVDGAARPALPFDSNKVIILKDGRFVIMQGKLFTHGVLKADPTKNPKQYDSTIMRGPAKGMTFPCIYELDADTFRLCGPYLPGERPKEFVTKPGSGLVMQVLKREKQNVPDAQTETARKELEGSWYTTPRVRNAMGTEGAILIFEADGKFRENGAKGLWNHGITKIDAVTDPMAIDFIYTEEPISGLTYLSLAQVDGTTLTVVRAMRGQMRPTELSSKFGWKVRTYERDAEEN